MDNYLLIATSLLSAYLIGSLPTAYIVGRLRKGIDIRQVGSRNMGAMNVFYSVGFIEGLLVLVIDIGKGALAILLSRYLNVYFIVELIAGVLVVVGHNFPVFLSFRGGKGGATALGVLISFMPWGIPFYAAILIITLVLTHYPTVSYSLAFICFPFVAWFINSQWELVVYSIVVIMLPMIRYIPRLKEMRKKGGSWYRVFLRRNIRDRL